MVLAGKEKHWAKPKDGANWRRALNVHCKPIRKIMIDAIQTADVVRTLKPVMERTPETGRQLRYRIEYVIDYATTLGMREGDNPARWRGHLKHIFANTSRDVKRHFPAMPYEELPSFIHKIREKDTMPALALEFTILTAARTGEALGAMWPEINLETAVWTIPAQRMKMKTQHTVPLPNRAMEILHELYELQSSDYVFPGQRPNRPLSNMSMTMVLRRMDLGHYTVHGFRSSFRTWCGDKTTVAREIAEQALSHRLGNAAELAYSRGDALEKRQALMQMWADYCDGLHTGDVVPLHAV